MILNHIYTKEDVKKINKILTSLGDVTDGKENTRRKILDF